MKNEEKFKAEKEELGLIKATKTNKTVEGGWLEKLDSALYIWLCQEREKGNLITGQVLLANASELHLFIYGEHSRSFLANIVQIHIII